MQLVPYSVYVRMRPSLNRELCGLGLALLYVHSERNNYRVEQPKEQSVLLACQ